MPPGVGRSEQGEATWVFAHHFLVFLLRDLEHAQVERLRDPNRMAGLLVRGGLRLQRSRPHHELAGRNLHEGHADRVADDAIAGRGGRRNARGEKDGKTGERADAHGMPRNLVAKGFKWTRRTLTIPALYVFPIKREASRFGEEGMAGSPATTRRNPRAAAGVGLWLRGCVGLLDHPARVGYIDGRLQTSLAGSALTIGQPEVSGCWKTKANRSTTSLRCPAPGCWVRTPRPCCDARRVSRVSRVHTANFVGPTWLRITLIAMTLGGGVMGAERDARALRCRRQSPHAYGCGNGRRFSCALGLRSDERAVRLSKADMLRAHSDACLAVADSDRIHTFIGYHFFAGFQVLLAFLGGVIGAAPMQARSSGSNFARKQPQTAWASTCLHLSCSFC